MRSYKGLKSFCYGLILFASVEGRANETSVFDLETPRYQKSIPQWGFELSSSLSAFGSQSQTQTQGDNQIAAFSLGIEYQPAFIQKFGVLSIGPYYTLYPEFTRQGTDAAFALQAAGGTIRYQARYFLEQIVVPMIAYQVEHFQYRYSKGPSGSLVAKGPTFGLWFLLNSLDRSTASQMYMNTGISRSYAVLEFRVLQGKNTADDVNFYKGSYYFGLRFEM